MSFYKLKFLPFSNIDRICEGIGDKFGLLIRTFVQFTAGIFVAFFWSWQMALPLSVLSPIIATAMSLSAKVRILKGHIDKLP